MDELKILRGDPYIINSSITIRQPTIGEIADYGEEAYYTMVQQLCATSSDCKIFLEDYLHVDFTTVSDFEMFQMICGSFSKEQTKILFGDLDFKNMYLVSSNDVCGKYLKDFDSEVRIDESVYLLIVDFLRKIHKFERHFDNPGTASAKRFMLNKARRLQQRNAGKPFESILSPLISAMTNTPGFKYDHKEVWDLPIYTFMDCVARVQKSKGCDHLFQGIYAGTVDPKKISSDSLNWLSPI